MIAESNPQKGLVMSFDLAVSRAVTLAHALERALHDPGPWFIELDGYLASASREVCEDALTVTFAAHFLRADAGAVPILRCRGDEVRALASVSPSEQAFEYRFELSLPAGVAA
jgi:hypothetical protein